MRGGWVVVLTTAATREEAERIARALLEEKLVACVNIVDAVKSLYWWRGTIETSNEVLLVAKTRADKLPGVEKTIKSLHSYEVPEIIALPVVSGSDEYLEWLDQSIREKEGPPG